MGPVRAMWFVNHARFWGAVALGVVVFLALPQSLPALTRALTAWNVAALVFMGLIYTHHPGLSAQQLRDRYRADDPSAPVSCC